MEAHVREMFEQAGCHGQLCVCSMADGTQFCVDADSQVVAASVFKVLVALETETQFTQGRLNPEERLTLPATSRTPGPSGFSLFRDDVTASLRDLVVSMITISDNDATDALLRTVGIETVNAQCKRLGLGTTVVVEDVRSKLNGLARDMGFADWATLSAWNARPHTDDEEAAAVRRMLRSAALDPGRTTRTSPRDMATLLRLIWSDRAGPAPACDRVRQHLSRQLTTHRLAAAFPPPARVAAKSGSLVGIIRNEIGVISYPDGRHYAAAVFTQGYQPGQDPAPINAVIGRTAAAAVSALAGRAA